MESPPIRKFSSPEEEIAYLRARINERERDSGQSPESGPPRETIAREELGTYSRFTPQSVLEKEYRLGARAVTSAAERVRTSEDQVTEVVELAHTKGIRNALSVLEKLDNAFVTDEAHRRLVQDIQQGREVIGTKEGAPLWGVLHMTLFEVTLPEEREKEAGQEAELKGLISAMEQFYAGMQAISGEKGLPRHFTLEIAVSDKSDDIIFYAAVPTMHIDLFEKQLLSLFPNAQIVEQKSDYNIFVDGGTAFVSEMTLSRHPVYPIRGYETFDRDPLHVLLNAFSKIEREGGGAAFQVVLRPQKDTYRKQYEHIIKKVRDGMPIKKAIHMTTIGGQAIELFKDMFSSSKKKKDEDEEEKHKVDESLVELLEEKVARPIIPANIRIAVSAGGEARAVQILNDIEAGFHQFENTKGNRIVFKKPKGRALRRALRAFSFREYLKAEELPLSITELSSIIHFPVQDVRFSPQVKQTRAQQAAAPIDMPQDGTLLGTNTYRNTETPVYITADDRLRHFYIIGQTGTGKTTLMKNMIIQDIEQGNGVCMIDPHGTDIVDVLAAVPPEREQDVIYFDPAYTERSIGLNMLEFDPAHPEQKTFVVNELFSIFQKLYGAVPESMGPIFEQYFRNATLLVLEDPESGNTLMDVSRVMADASYRKLKLSKTHNPVVKQFWEEIATKAGGEAALENIVPYITSKFDVFTANDYMRPIIGQQRSSINFRRIMDEKKILLVNLSKGRLGEINANLIGMIIVGKLLMAALSRVDDLSRSLPPFYLHMDEFQNVTTDSITAILSEARKYKLGLTIANQYIAQLTDEIRDAVFGNVGSIAAFRVGPEDGEFLEKQFEPTFSAHDLVNIENQHAYVRLLAKGTPQKPFSIHTVAPRPVDYAKAQERIARLYAAHGRPREEVEAEIAARYQRPPVPVSGSVVV
ncbi:DUF87 domain-containing protein [Candidatus Kaiserbacteria bacterium]|nr:DUF87 domain-containing protein [Candidatus Kaiserbacteria bacterium]